MKRLTLARQSAPPKLSSEQSHKMKAFVLFMLPIVCLAFRCCAEEASTNIVGLVLVNATFQNREAARLRLDRALRQAVFVIEATILNSDTQVETSPKQRDGSVAQGWSAAAVQPTRVFKGDPKVGTLLVENLGRRTGGAIRHAPIEAINGQKCILVLEKDGRLSRWCQTNVYTVMQGLEVR